MSNSLLIPLVYTLGTIGTIVLIRRIAIIVFYRRYMVDYLLYAHEDFPFEPEYNRLPLKVLLVQICRTVFKTSLISGLLIPTLMFWFDLSLIINREMHLNLAFMDKFYGSDMAILNLAQGEDSQTFLYFLLFLGMVLMFEPLCEIFYFKAVTYRLCPKNSSINGLERYLITKEIEDRFYSAPFSLMSKSRKFVRKFLFGMGVSFILSWLLLHTLI